jgi:hypothetical protein
MRCTRSGAAPRLSSFEFAVITNGDRPEQLAEFVASINGILGIDDISAGIAICGPESVRDGLPESRIPVRVIPAPVEFADRAWITGKKNRIVESSEFENLVIVHDRFAVPKEFLTAMYEFGGDFDILNPAQVDVTGQRVGDWVSTGSRTPIMGIALLDYNDFDPGTFVNGGAIIAKRAALLAVPWSELLFWGQAEDVELSRAFETQGFTPRLARRVQLLVTDARAGFREFFTPLPMLERQYGSLVEPRSTAGPTIGVAGFGRYIQLADTSAADLAAQGVSIPSDAWVLTPEGLLPRSQQSELSLDVAHPIDEELRVCMEVRSPSHDIVIRANSQQLRTTVTSMAPASWLAECLIPVEAITFASNGPLTHARSVRLGITSAEPSVITALQIVRATPTASYPIRLGALAEPTPRLLGAGWAEVEPWGVWSIGRTADVNLPIPSGVVGRDLHLECTLATFERHAAGDLVVGVMCEGIALTSLIVPCDGRTIRANITCPGQLVAEHREIRLQFQIANPTSPSALGISTDPRELGIGLRTIAVRTRAPGLRPRRTVQSRRGRVGKTGFAS